MSQDIGLIGLAVMGQNLALNMSEKGFQVSCFNRTASKVQEFLEGSAKGTSIKGFFSLPEFFASLARPRKVLFMVKAGDPVDELIEQSIPYLEPGDIIIDGGNSFFKDTERRVATLKARGIRFLGVGISGGEEGARHGPSIMPGGNKEAWPYVKPILQAIAANVQGESCCEWVGEGGAGHFVKMVHNGIEYGDMELIAETYDILKSGLSFQAEELQSLFSSWNKGKLQSFLIEITGKIFEKRDEDGVPLVEKILDVAGQKGTGKWTVESALELGVPLTLIGEAVFARHLSARYDERKEVSSFYGEKSIPKASRDEMVPLLEQALYAAKIISYTQGFMLLQEASRVYGWNLDLGQCALLWRGGCIIRSAFLGKIKEAFQKNPSLSSLLLDPFFSSEMKSLARGLKEATIFALSSSIYAPCFASALTFFDGLRSKRLSTNLIQAQRDFFGAHTFERIDAKRGEFFHADWSI